MPSPPDPGRNAWVQQLSDFDRRITALESQARVTTYQKIGDFVVADSGIHLRYDGIPQTFNHLLVQFVMQSTRAANNTGARFAFSTAAGPVSSSYEFDYYGYQISSGVAGVYQGDAQAQTNGYLGQCPAATRLDDNHVQKGTIDIPFYHDNNIKMFNVRSVCHDGLVLRQAVTVGNVNTSTNGAVTALLLGDDVGSVLGPRRAASLYGAM